VAALQHTEVLNFLNYAYVPLGTSLCGDQAWYVIKKIKLPSSYGEVYLVFLMKFVLATCLDLGGPNILVFEYSEARYA
jgi:hypothetical protein